MKPIVSWQPPMRRVLYALAPVVAASVWFFGWRALVVVAVVNLAAFLTEYVFTRFTKAETTSAVFVTGTLLGLSLPPTIPIWIAVVGAVFGVFFGKMVFGGFGRNVFNPALVGRIFIYVSFAVPMNARWADPIPAATGALSFPWGAGGFSRWASDALTGATPLRSLREGAPVDLLPLVWGNVAGSLGETSAVLILLGGLYIIWKKAANWRIVVSELAAIVVLQGIFWLAGVRNAARPPEHRARGQRDARHVLHGHGPDLRGADPGRSVDLRRARGMPHRADPHLLDLARGHDVRDPARQHLRADRGLAHPSAPAEAEGRGRAGGRRGHAAGGRRAVNKRVSLVLFTVAVTIVFIAPITFAYLLTKPLVALNEEVFLKRAVLAAAGLEVPPEAAAAKELFDGAARGAADDPDRGGRSRARAGLPGNGRRRAPGGWVITRTGPGLWGDIVMVVGFAADRARLSGIEFLKQSETPGLGARISEPWFKQQFKGKRGPFTTVGEGEPAAENQFDAITGATITSNAVKAIVNAVVAAAGGLPGEESP